MTFFEKLFYEKRREANIKSSILPWRYEYCSEADMPLEILEIDRFANQKDLEIQHVVKGQIEETNFVYFDIYYFGEMIDNTYAIFQKSYVAFKTSDPLPDFEIEPKNLTYRFYRLVGHVLARIEKEKLPDPVSFPNDSQFNKRYAVNCDDEAFTKRFVTEALRRKLSDDKEKWLLRGHGEWVVIITDHKDCLTGDHRVKPAEIKDHVEECYGFFRLAGDVSEVQQKTRRKV